MAKHKTDRRTLYTKELIKNTLLDLMKKKEFVKITVTTICQTAEINRGTFYLHYCDVYSVLDELISDMMSETTSLIDHIMCSAHTQGGCTYPFCARIQENTKYQILFLDESISSILVDTIAEAGKEDFVTWIMKHSLLTFEEAEAIYYFQINGCLSINRQALKNKSTSWKVIQQTIDKFIKSGLETFLIPDRM
jgi:AcrR family transcriptional regulator